MPSVAMCTMPVFGYAGPDPQEFSASTGIDSTDQRLSFGGGFSVLEAAGWKGTDRPNGMQQRELTGMQPSRTLMPSDSVESSASKSLVSSLQSHPRPASAAASAAKKVRVQAANSVPDLQSGRPPSASSTAAAGGLPHLQLGRPGSASQAQRLSTSSSAPQVHNHNVLHGPSERQVRPLSAVVPPGQYIQAQSLTSIAGRSQSGQGTNNRRNGSAIFDG